MVEKLKAQMQFYLFPKNSFLHSRDTRQNNQIKLNNVSSTAGTRSVNSQMNKLSKEAETSYCSISKVTESQSK